jgi:predicted RNA binding protein with dsRBD fold (UPF0201 family)
MQVVYNFKANSQATMLRSVETEFCISSSDRDGSVHVRVLYEEISAGRQLLKLIVPPNQGL